MTQNQDKPKKAPEKSEDITKEDKKLQEIKNKAKEYLAGWQRAKADYENYKKENENRQKELIRFSNAALIMEILPIYDNFCEAFKHLPEDLRKSEWVKGIEHIKSQYWEVLKNSGVEKIKTVGEKFNPEIHEAVSHEEKEGFDADTIFEEVKPGYMIYGKVLRPAMVNVAKLNND